MSKYTMEKMLTAELASLNRAIDRRICLGLSYAREAREHKLVLSRLIRLKRATAASHLGRFSFASNLFR